MPKINVYLPDDLAAAVRTARLPVSPICQQALAEALRMVEVARAGIEVIRDPAFDPSTHPRITTRVAARMTPRLHETIRLARAAAGPGGQVETRHLLIGLLDEAENLGTRLLEALDVDLAGLRDQAAQSGSSEPAPEAGNQQAGGEASVWDGLSAPARLVIAGALEAAVDFGHNYIGCEHLLLSLASLDDSEAAEPLRRAGADPDSLRRAITTAAAGFSQARQAAPTMTMRLDEVLRRLAGIEDRITAGGL
jgi:ATP-dependent Clp protease ATP-binding subunit ClpA